MKPDTQYSVDEPQIHHPEREKPDIEGHRVPNSIYMKCPKEANSLRQEAACWLQGLREGLQEGTAHENRVPFWGDENDLQLDTAGGCTIL